jgi:phosphonate transport system substrate-binding protein
MKHQLSRRALLVSSLTVPLLLAQCNSRQSTEDPLGKLIVGVVNYDRGVASLDKFDRFKDYLAESTHAVIELEPAYNELKAVEQVHRRIWSLVFAPPGLAAIAIGAEQYIPLFVLQSTNNQRSVIVVSANSPIQSLADLANQVIALGEPGSAAGYYLPLYDLYGLTLAEVRFAPTPKTVLEWLNQGTIAAGALSEDEFQRYRGEFDRTSFRILHKSRFVPPGVVLLGPTVDRNQQRIIEDAMRNAPSSVIGDAGYVPDAPLPDYKYFIELVAKVRPLESRVKQTPAVLTMAAEPGSPEPSPTVSPGIPAPTESPKPAS